MGSRPRIALRAAPQARRRCRLRELERTPEQSRSPSPEPSPRRARIGTAREPVEQSRDELGRHAVAAIIDYEAEVPVPAGRRDGDRRLAVAHRVRDEVRDHPIQPCRIHYRVADPPGRRAVTAFDPSVERMDQLLDLGPEPNGLRRDSDRRQVEAGKVEQLLGEILSPGRLLSKRVRRTRALRLGQLVLSCGHRDGDAVDARQRVPQLVCGERDVLALRDSSSCSSFARKSALEHGCGYDARRSRAPCSSVSSSVAGTSRVPQRKARHRSSLISGSANADVRSSAVRRTRCWGSIGRARASKRTRHRGPSVLADFRLLGRRLGLPPRRRTRTSPPPRHRRSRGEPTAVGAAAAGDRNPGARPRASSAIRREADHRLTASGVDETSL